jgi:hypothetical protein
LPQEATAGDVKRGDIAEIPAGNVERSPVGRNIGILSVICGARALCLRARRIDIDRPDD